MSATKLIVAKSLLIAVAVLTVVMSSSKSLGEAKHWPDFSCHPVKDTKQQQRSVRYFRMGWNSCKSSWERTKQRCDKMCILMNRKIITRSKKEDPFAFDIEAFITLMLNELGYEKKHRKDAPQDLVDRVKGKLETCRTSHREYETMKNFNNLPCEPYVGLFRCVHNATECEGDF